MKGDRAPHTDAAVGLCCPQRPGTVAVLPAAHEAARLLLLGRWHRRVEHGRRQRGGKREEG